MGNSPRWDYCELCNTFYIAIANNQKVCLEVCLECIDQGYGKKQRLKYEKENRQHINKQLLSGEITTEKNMKH